MSKTITAERLSKTISTYPRKVNVQRQIADKMIRLFRRHIPSPCPGVIEFGYGADIYSRVLLHTPRPEELFLSDLYPEAGYYCEDLLREKRVSLLSEDAGTTSFPDKGTLTTSCSALQWFEPPGGLFKRCNTLLHGQGYFVFSAFGKKNIKEIREFTGKRLPYRLKEELETALSFHSDILYLEEELIPLSLEGPVGVLYHLKQTRVNGLSTRLFPYPKYGRQTWTCRNLQHSCGRYTQEFTQGASVSLTYYPIYIVARKKKV